MKLFYWVILIFTIGSCAPQSNGNFTKFNVDDELEQACKQLKILRDTAKFKEWNPRATYETGRLHWCYPHFDWTEGFFPGSLWLAYEITGNKQWKEDAQYFQGLFINDRFVNTNHDLGFVFNCSYGRGYDLLNNSEYEKVLVDAANTLSKRFNRKVGCIKSWDGDWGNKGWKYPVIIDNMMNLELLFKATMLTNDPTYLDIAVSHANTTLKNHYRSDMSSYHVVDYDINTGEVKRRNTAQGFADESAWARGQAWGLYGFTMCYRFTHDKKYLDFAKRIADFMLKHPNMPEDLVPYWDFNAPNIPYAPRDVSAAAVMASALVELATYDEDYLEHAKAVLESLSSDNYKNAYGTNNGFILRSSVGHANGPKEINVPIVYADYYFLEALLRLKEYKTK
ncbi:MAG: glycoside hydrolase family 88 protein [Carboxylicivirga sp.]|jgi:rhamnogalacturonyl hydrolase YesR|nr:glycoside hydrolase family 88 protein [Carboxylicivirga sp.]